MAHKKGQISVNTNDIFPIIKKWLYSEHDIFLRELIANATDAITKRAALSRNSNVEVPEGKIHVQINPEAKTIEVTDNGLGMSEAEVEKYIAQLAFSGAQEFLEKMKAQGADTGKEIIGKFGLGFFSTFMVADKVEVDTLSMNEGAKACHWSCDGDTEYTFSDSTRTEVGTKITLHINKDSEDFLKEYKLTETLKNHCDFMPYPIFLDTFKKEDDKDKEKKEEEENKAQPLPLNNTAPLWKKDPNDLKDEDYKSFFRNLFPLDPEPLFWLHLKVDHPFTLEGILYFPKINLHRPFHEHNIKLYCKQVFVSDNVKNIIPEFLSLLKGVVDSNDIPLNVSRSSLQGDPNIKKISNYIIKKVAEALKKLFKNDRARYEEIWQDIGLFVKYGCVSDSKFDETMREMVIFKNSEGKYMTLEEYKESVPADFKEKLSDKIIYFEKEKSDQILKQQLLEEKIQTLEMDEHIDPHFMQHVEMQAKGEKKYKFACIDSEIENIFLTENATEDDIKIKELFTKILLGEEALKEKNEEEKKNPFDAKMEVEIKKLKNATSPAYFKVDEQMKRFAQMSKSMGQENAFPLKKTLVINPNNKLIQNALKISQKGDNDLAQSICHYVQDLATISSEGLKAEQKDVFVTRTQGLVERLSHFAL